MRNTKCRSGTALNTVWIDSLQQPWILIHSHKEVHKQCAQRLQKRLHFLLKHSLFLSMVGIFLSTQLMLSLIWDLLWPMKYEHKCHVSLSESSLKHRNLLLPFFFLTSNMCLILAYVSYSSRFFLSHEYFSCPICPRSHAILGFNIFETLLTGS